MPSVADGLERIGKGEVARSAEWGLAGRKQVYRLAAIICEACWRLVSVTLAPLNMRATSWVRARSSMRECEPASSAFAAPLDVLAQGQVHAGLIALSLALKPVDDVGIHA